LRPHECEIPLASALRPRWVEDAYFSDAYRAPLKSPPPSVTDIFRSIFGHPPKRIKHALLLRNRIAKQFGLDVPSKDLILEPEWRERYQAGETIGPWPILGIDDTELIVGRNNRHLDFRLSIFRELGIDQPSVVISTVCVTHHWSGKIYLFFVVPFHRWGVQYLIKRALLTGRL
jgi:Protein of unknown function (DUF2867)